MEIPKMCEICGEEAPKKCGKCMKVRYCSVECQKKDWPIHKSLCGQIGAKKNEKEDQDKENAKPNVREDPKQNQQPGKAPIYENTFASKAMAFICSHNLPALGSLIETEKNLDNLLEIHNRTPLLTYCTFDNVQLNIVKMLVEKGKSDVNRQDKFGYSCLHLLCAKYQPQVEIVEYLIKKGANVNLRANNRRTPLHSACMPTERNLSLVKLLIESGANKDAADVEGKIPLHLACRFNYSGVVFQDERTKKKEHKRVKKAHLEIVKYLLSLGYDANYKDKKGRTALHHAHLNSTKEFELIWTLAGLGYDVDEPDELGVLPFVYMIEKKNPTAFSFLSCI